MNTNPTAQHLSSLPPAAQPRANAPARPPGIKKILVVDNEPASTRLVRLILEKHTVCEVRELNDPTLAVATALQFQPDLVLLDIEMPVMDGSSVAELLHAQPRLRSVPIIFLTGLVTGDEAASRMFTGGSRLLAKPATSGELTRTVAEVFNLVSVSAKPKRPTATGW